MSEQVASSDRHEAGAGRWVGYRVSGRSGATSADPGEARRKARAGPVVVPVVALVALVAAAAAAAAAHRVVLIDLAVYRVGARVVLDGRSLYAGPFRNVQPGLSLPFTYPPFAALCFVPLTVLPAAVAAGVWTATGLVALGAALVLVGRGLGAPLGWRSGATLMIAAVAVEPVWQTLFMGQVNLLLLGAVVVDAVALRNRRGQGVLIGLAAAVKLTPAVFVLYLLAGKQWRAAGVATAAFAVASGLAALVLPSDSRTYWSSTVFLPSRIGGLTFSGNQSLRGALARLDIPGGVPLWVASSVVVIAAACLAATRLREQDRDVEALLAVALAGLLISPISWSHHWVWLVVAVMALVRRAVDSGSRTPAVLAAVTAVLAAVPVHRMLPKHEDRELAWVPWQHVTGNTVTILGLVLIGWLAATCLRARPATTAAGVVTGARTGGRPPQPDHRSGQTVARCPDRRAGRMQQNLRLGGICRSVSCAGASC